MAIFSALLRWLTGDVLAQLTRAFEIQKNATTEEQKQVAAAVIADMQRQIADRAAAKEIRLATAGFWEMRAITFLIAAPFVVHLNLVALDTCFRLGWRISAFPAPFDAWEGTILLSFFGVQAVGQSVNTIAAAIRGRRA